MNNVQFNIISELANRYENLTHEQLLSLMYCREWDRLAGLSWKDLLAEYLRHITITEGGSNDTNEQS
jgi:hypothetical protein